MLVIASAMSLAAGLLATFAWLGVGGRGRGVGLRLRGRGRLGFASEETAFEFADFALEEMHLILEYRFALDGSLMLGSPIVGLLPQENGLHTQPTEQHPCAKDCQRNNFRADRWRK